MSEPRHEITILSRAGCHLCDIAKTRVENVARQVACTVRVVDITTDAEMQARYAERIPVVLLDGEEAYAYRVSERGLMRMVRRGSVRRGFPRIWKRSGKT